MLNIVDEKGVKLADDAGSATPGNDNRRVMAFHGGVRSITRLAELLTSELDFFVSGDRVFLFNESADPQLQPISINQLREIIDSTICGLRLVLRGGRLEKERHRLGLTRQDVTDCLSEIMKLGHTNFPQVARKLSEMQTDHIRQRMQQGETPAALAEVYKTTVAEIQALRAAS